MKTAGPKTLLDEISADLEDYLAEDERTDPRPLLLGIVQRIHQAKQAATEAQQQAVSGELEKVRLCGGKRANIAHSEFLDDWWVGYGKDEFCQFEGPWKDMAILAAKVLRHPNTAKVAPNIHWPDVPITPEQEANY